MTVASFKDIAGAYDAGQVQYSSFRKVPAIATTAGIWADLSMSPGNPSPNYYSGDALAATALNGNRGLYHGQAVSGTKHVSKITTICTTAAGAPQTLLLCDYLLFYPLVDMDATDEQFMDNTVTLPRYTTGAGVQAFLVATNPYVGGATFSMKYTNSDGTTGQVSQTLTSNSATTIATLISAGTGAGQNGPFIPLATGDKGIRAVESITFSAANGGLATLVLCKPLAQTLVREVTAPCEKSLITETSTMPRVYDGAYLNFLTLPNGSLATVPITGDIEFIWN